MLAGRILTPPLFHTWKNYIMVEGRKLLGKILIDKEVIDEDKLKQALLHQQENGGKLGEALVELDHATEEEVTRALAEQYNIPYVDLNQAEITEEIINLVPERVALEYNVLPINKNGRRLTVVMSDPLDLFAMDNLRFILNMDIDCVLAPKSQLADAIDQYYESRKHVSLEDLDERGDVGVSVRGAEVEEGVEGDDAPIIRLVHLVIAEAIRQRASDIHIEPLAHRLRIRYRIDGVCFEVDNQPKINQGPILSRVKIMAGMDIAEKRRAQDGRINLTVEGREIDIRVSALPCTHGESVVMRLLDKERGLKDLEALGFDESDLKRFNTIIKRPNGILLITGPTGSGKTTTLYAALKQLNRPDVKIITAENPVEYLLTGINQCEVKPKIGLDFSRILRAMLRQAPNIILVGEIRDKETAEIAIQAALTGHLVCSTLHTNDAPSAITRLVDLGVKPFLVSSSILAIMAQRLVRVLCENCKEPYHPTETELAAVGMTPDIIEGHTIFRPTGCARCRHSGYRGRLGVFELMEMSNELRGLTFDKASTQDLRKSAIMGGMTTLQEDGVRKVLAGVTSIEEVLRLTHMQEAAEGWAG
ncbi:MAG: ATPase, T2SS/T4P/T4SS family [Planctomycetota bacterium]